MTFRRQQGRGASQGYRHPTHQSLAHIQGVPPKEASTPRSLLANHATVSRNQEKSTQPSKPHISVKTTAAADYPRHSCAHQRQSDTSTDTNPLPGIQHTQGRARVSALDSQAISLTSKNGRGKRERRSDPSTTGGLPCLPENVPPAGQPLSRPLGKRQLPLQPRSNPRKGRTQHLVVLVPRRGTRSTKLGTTWNRAKITVSARMRARCCSWKRKRRGAASYRNPSCWTSGILSRAS